MPSVSELLPWLGFAVLVLLLLSADMAIFHRRIRAPSVRESLGWTLVWVALAIGFNAFIWSWRGSKAGTEFATGYLVEWSLSMDNLFVFAVIFRFFAVELQYQYRVLFWGVLGAIVLRLAFILVGTALTRRFEWILPLFGALLVYTALKLAFGRGEQVEPERNWVLRLARRWFPVTRQEHAQRFFVVEAGRRCMTPLFLVLLVIESTDVLFAVDSVPAIFGVTKDPFIIFTSNIFAILGLRALYFLLASVMDLFHYLVYGLSAVLAFIGLKMIVEYLLPHAGDHLLAPWVSLLVIAALIGLAIGASLIFRRTNVGWAPPTGSKAKTVGGAHPTGPASGTKEEIDDAG
jgi:tellurite resistance protein TerC